MTIIVNVYLCDREPAIDSGCGLSSLIKLRRLRFQVARNIAIGRAVCQTIRNTLSRDSVEQISCEVISGKSPTTFRRRGTTNMQIWERSLGKQFNDKKFLT